MEWRDPAFLMKQEAEVWSVGRFEPGQWGGVEGVEGFAQVSHVHFDAGVLEWLVR